MEAIALPSARLMLACSWRRAAARIAAAVSRNNAIAAMITPMIASGTAAAAPPACSAGGAKLFARQSEPEPAEQARARCGLTQGEQRGFFALTQSNMVSTGVFPQMEAIWPCPRRLKQRSLPRNGPESGECRSTYQKPAGSLSRSVTLGFCGFGPNGGDSWIFS